MLLFYHNRDMAVIANIGIEEIVRNRQIKSMGFVVHDISDLSAIDGLCVRVRTAQESIRMSFLFYSFEG